MLDVICKYLSVVSLLILPNKVKLYCIGNSIKGKSVLPVDLKIYCVCVFVHTHVCAHTHTEYACMKARKGYQTPHSQNYRCLWSKLPACWWKIGSRFLQNI